MSIRAKQRSILRSFVALLVTLVGAAALLIVGGVLHYDAELKTSRRISGFHLRTMVLLGEIEAEIVRIQHQLAFEGRSRGIWNLQTSVQSIHRNLEAVAALQDESGTPLFTRTMDRALQRSGEVLGAAGAGMREARQYEDLLSSLGFTIHQLERLHAVAVDDLLLESSLSLRSAGFLAGAAALLTVISAVVARLFVLVRERLRDLHETERTLRETEAQLVQSQKLEALGTLVGGIAHDFNNVLTAILGNADVLASELDPESLSGNSAQQIQVAGQRAAAMTNRLLLFSRPDFSDPKVVDVAALVRGVQPMLRRLVREDIRLDLEVEDSAGCVLVDPVQIEQVLMNLTVNASDAMPEGGRLILRATAYRLDEGQAPGLQLEPGPYVQITVIDDGHGMSEEVRSRIFEPFFTTKPGGKGTGLGLSTVHGIVTRAGGAIRVRSEPGRGSVFDVFLTSCDPVPHEQPDIAKDPPRGAGETILIVEDEAMVRMVTEATLRDAGYETLAAGGVQEAERLCHEHGDRIDLILSDVVMPDARGPDLIERLLEACPDCAVVYMSGYSEEELLGSVRVSNRSFIPKPFHSTRLREVVRDALDRQRTGPAMATES